MSNASKEVIFLKQKVYTIPKEPFEDVHWDLEIYQFLPDTHCKDLQWNHSGTTVK